MASIGVPPTMDRKDIPTDIYEVVTAPYKRDPDRPAEEIPNTFYDPENDPPTKATQLKWTLLIREDTELHGIPLTYYTGSAIGRHPRNKLTNTVKLTDPTFDIDKAYKDLDDFLQKNSMRPIRAVVESITKEKDGKPSTYAKVTGLMPSKLGELQEFEKLIFAADVVRNSDPLA